jgi:pimeloyl-ACP methyl ester carboxylesterase
MNLHARLIGLAVCACFDFAGATHADDRAAIPTRIRLAGKLSPRRLPRLDEEVLGGKYEVYENRAARAGRKIGLEVVVMPAKSDRPRLDPLVFLAGGGVAPATRYAPFLSRALAKLREERDILLVDQRGTGGSNPLTCSLPDPLVDPGAYFDEEQYLAAVRAARAELEKRADLRYYTTPLAMDDLDDIREWLGYEQLDIWGASYGTKAAQVYSRQHPERVRVLALHGVVPLSSPMWLDLAGSAQRGLDRVLGACAGDSTCGRAFPRIRAELDSVLARLARAPDELRVASPDSATGRVVRLGDRILRDAITDALYAADSARELPFLIHEAFLGHSQPLARLVGPGEGRTPQGVFLCLCCSEEIPLVDAGRIAPATADTYVGDFPLRRQIAACTAWPRGWLPEGYWHPVKTDVPVLLLSGALDHTTPPEYAETLAATLGHSRHVILPGRGHNDIDPCVVGLIEDFVMMGGFDGLDMSCAETPKPLQFVTDASQLRQRRGP